MVSHPTGINEVEEGSFDIADDQLTLSLASVSVSSSSTAKSVTAVERRIHLRGDVLEYRLSMAAVGLPLQHHLAATLERQTAGSG